LRIFTRHPASVGETYGEHCRAASSFALRMIAGGLRCLVHAFLPFLYVSAGSDCVAELHGQLTARKDSAQRPAAGDRCAHP
jgi:hypothetical protein